MAKSVRSNPSPANSRALGHLLLDADSGHSALRLAYEYKKAGRQGFSLEALGRRVGLASKGYLSDVLKGRRRISLKHEAGLFDALDIGTPARAYVSALIARDREGEDVSGLTERIAATRSVLAAHLAAHADLALPPTFFAFEVFCATYLFGGRPTEADLLGYFGPAQAGNVRAAVAYLTSTGLFAQEGDAYLRAVPHFVVGDAAAAELTRFVGSAIRDAAVRVSTWLEQRERAHFESTVVSVKRADYERMLPRIREEMLSMQTRLDSDEPDELIRFNVQIYPLGDNSR